jgi:hypothetical protein
MRTTTKMRTTSNSLADEAPTSSALLANSPSTPPVHPIPDSEEDQDTGDLPTGVDEDALDNDPLDTDTITAPD